MLQAESRSVMSIHHKISEKNISFTWQFEYTQFATVFGYILLRCVILESVFLFSTTLKCYDLFVYVLKLNELGTEKSHFREIADTFEGN